MVLKKKKHPGSSSSSWNIPAMVEKATDDILTGPDWSINLEICDIVNTNPVLSREVVKALKKRINNKNPKVQLLALTVLEMVMKNCGELVHKNVAEKAIPAEMAKSVKKADKDVRYKILMLLDSWQQAFGGAAGKYPQYYTAYDDLQRSGVEFPEQNPVSSAVFTSPATHSTTVSPNGGRNQSGGKVNIVVTIAENPVVRDLNDAQRGVEVLSDVLNALDPSDKQAAHDDLIVQLVDQCRINQKSIRQLVNSTSDEGLLCRILTLNDDLQQILDKYDAMLLESQTESLKNHSIFDQDDEEAEDVSQLTHRSSSKAAGATAHRPIMVSANSLQSDQKLNTMALGYSSDYPGKAASPTMGVESQNMPWQEPSKNSGQIDTFFSVPKSPSNSKAIMSSPKGTPSLDSPVEMGQNVPTQDKKNTDSSLPPPPIRFNERERYFKQRNQTCRNPEFSPSSPIELQSSGMKRDSVNFEDRAYGLRNYENF